MTKKTIMGEKSIPPKDVGIFLLIGASTGSVMLCINRTIGLYGSGFTQDRTALAMMTH